ncbi:RNA-binding domain-containing protein [Saccharothrix hoggarensis]|uniref:RNA-binding domain-containing protein n=1 Tax=Saccharothrix hoggarensis TaxID=913853 RepID=A0ABW3QK54_9PSEU
MPIRWSRIHVELGLGPAALTYNMVRRAVEAGIAEAEDLDWKQALIPPVEKKWWEFAKDVAAMANTRGGLIVFGVREDAERAAGLVGVPNGDAERQRLRSYALRWVRPVISELVIEPLDDEENGGPGLIVVFVPASPDAPHVVGEKNEMGVPYRSGPHTDWMSEAQLERAYRDRFARQTDDRAALHALIDGLVPELLYLDDAVWLAVATRPTTSPPPQGSRPDREHTAGTMRTSLELAGDVLGVHSERFQVLSGDGSEFLSQPRTGLRRWTFRSNRLAVNPHARVDRVMVELHHDGSIALAVNLATFLYGAQVVEDKRLRDVLLVPIAKVDGLLVEAVAVASTHVRRLGGAGTILARAVLLTTPGKPLVAVDRVIPGSISPVEVVTETWPVRVPLAVEAEFDADGDVPALHTAARQLAEDIHQQFGSSGAALPPHREDDTTVQ